MRLSFVHNPFERLSGTVDHTQRQSARIAQLQDAGLLPALTPRQLALELGISDVGFDETHSESAESTYPLPSAEVLEPEAYAAFGNRGRLVARKAGLAAGSMGLLVNGRVSNTFLYCKTLKLTLSQDSRPVENRQSRSCRY